MLLGSREAYLNYIPFSFISLDESPYHFRRTDPDSIAALQSSLTRSGQTHPVTLLEVSPEKFLVLDGHRRCEAIRHVRDSGGSWEKILAQVVPYGEFPLLDRFRLLTDKNLKGDNSYSLTERAQFFRDFVALGMTVLEIAIECAISAGTVEDTIDLLQTPPELAPLLDSIAIEPVFALMLLRRYKGWMNTTHASTAPLVAENLKACRPRENHHEIMAIPARFLLGR